MSLIDESIFPITAADLPVLAQFIFASNLPQPTNQFLFKNWPNENAQLSLYRSGFEQTLADPETEMLKVVDQETGEMIASLILNRKLPSADSPLHAADSRKPEVPDGVNRNFLALLRQTLNTVQESMAEVDHYGLFIITLCLSLNSNLLNHVTSNTRFADIITSPLVDICKGR
jgi:hypothetical protein